MQLWPRPWWPYPQFMLASGWKILVQFANKVGLPVYLLRQLSSPWYSTEKYMDKIPIFWELTQLKMYAFGINIVFSSGKPARVRMFNLNLLVMNASLRLTNFVWSCFCHFPQNAAISFHQPLSRTPKRSLNFEFMFAEHNTCFLAEHNTCLLT